MWTCLKRVQRVLVAQRVPEGSCWNALCRLVGFTTNVCWKVTMWRPCVLLPLLFLSFPLPRVDHDRDDDQDDDDDDDDRLTTDDNDDVQDEDEDEDEYEDDDNNDDTDDDVDEDDAFLWLKGEGVCRVPLVGLITGAPRGYWVSMGPQWHPLPHSSRERAPEERGSGACSVGAFLFSFPLCAHRARLGRTVCFPAKGGRGGSQSA